MTDGLTRWDICLPRSLLPPLAEGSPPHYFVSHNDGSSIENPLQPHPSASLHPSHTRVAMRNRAHPTAAGPCWATAER